MIIKYPIYIALLAMILATSFVEASTYEKPQWKNVLEALPEDEKKALDLFFRAALKDSLGGYVLFGEKPICLESIEPNPLSEKFTSRIFSSLFHRTDIYLRKGYEVWTKLPIKSQKYLIRLFEEPYCGGQELIIVNKNQVKKVVEENLYLFKYILGPKLEANNFLDSLEKSNGSFYGLLKNDRVIIGILLGYGIENSLKASRQEYIDEGLWDYEQVLPLKSGRVKSKLPNEKKNPELEEPGYYQRNIEGSSFAFSTLFEEKQWLEKGHGVSLKRASKKNAFPWFGYWEGKESEEILSSYLETQKKLEKILESEHFLEVIFESLFSE